MQRVGSSLGRRGPFGFCQNWLVVDAPTPDSAAKWLLELVFGSPSLMVSTYVVVNALWSWWSLGRGVIESTAALLDRSHNRPVFRSLKVGATIRTTVAWIVLYIPASFATQLWAGSQYSPEQGGGLFELVRWSGAFGIIAVAGCAFIVPTRGPRYGDPNWAPLFGLFGGYALGFVWAIVAFTIKGGPSPGDWWVCPALSCVGVLSATLRIRVKASRTEVNSVSRSRP